MRNIHAWALIAVTLLVGTSHAFAQDDTARDQEITRYLESADRILIYVIGGSDYKHYHPAYLDNDEGIRAIIKLGDEDYRWENSPLLKFIYPEGGANTIEEKLLASLKSRLNPSLLNRMSLKASRLDGISPYSDNLDKTILVTFYLGQQKIRFNEQELLMGSIVGTVDVDRRKEFQDAQKVFLPEPFLLHPESAETTSLDRSIDFAALQVSEYLNHLAWKYLEK